MYATKSSPSGIIKFYCVVKSVLNVNSKMLMQLYCEYVVIILLCTYYGNYDCS